MSETLVVGSIALDSIEAPGGSVKDALGGSASYGAVAASLFSPTKLVGIVGRDFPQEHLALFRKRGIDTAGLEIADGETFRWHGWYERNLNNRHTNTTLLNVFEHFQPTLPESYRSCPFVFLGNISPDLQMRVLDQTKKSKLVAMDTMNFWIEGMKDALTRVIKRVDVLLLSDHEARQYAETNNLVEAGRMLRKLGPRAVVIKKGEHGAMVFLKDRLHVVPAYPSMAVLDPTGAGDCFAGGFVGYLARTGKTSDDAIVAGALVGCAVASFAIEDFSLSRVAKAKPEELRKRIATLSQMTKVPAIASAAIAVGSAKSKKGKSKPAASGAGSKKGAKKK